MPFMPGMLISMHATSISVVSASAKISCPLPLRHDLVSPVLLQRPQPFAERLVVIYQCNA
jgi:hypothetical protein